MTRIGSLLAVSFLLSFVLSCSGSSGPTSPDWPLSPGPGSPQEIQGGQSGTYLWGIWEFYIDPVNETVEAVPIRGASYACNVNEFIDGPPSNLILRNMIVTNQTGYTDISLDVGLRHP